MRDFRGDIQLIPQVKHTTCYKDSRCSFSIETTHDFHFILQNVLSIMNKTGVAYKPSADCSSQDVEDEDVGESYQNGPGHGEVKQEKKEFMYKPGSESLEDQENNACYIVPVKLEPNVMKDFVTPDKEKYKIKQKGWEGNGTSEDPWTLHDEEWPYAPEVPISSPEVQKEILQAALRTVRRTGKSGGSKKEHEKRQSKVPVLYDSYVIQKPVKRQPRSGIKKGTAHDIIILSLLHL